MNEELTPLTRREEFLAAAAGEGECPTPLTRIEQFLAAAAGEGECPTPVTRLEEFLAAAAGEGEAPDPVTRVEMFLAAISGKGEAPEPVTRLEMFLAGWAEGGGGEIKTITGNAPLTFEALAAALVSLTQDGKTLQDGTPTPSSPVDIVCNNGTLKMVDDDLPSAYKRVLGYACDNNAMWEITGFSLKGSDTVRISFSVLAACNVFGCYQGTSATDNYDLYASVSSGSKYFRYADGTYPSYFAPENLGKRFDVVYTPNGSQGMPQDSTWTPKTFTSANDMLVGSTTVGGTSSKLKGNLYGNIIVDGRLNLIPCERVSDGVLGYYDTYTATFHEPYEGFDGAVSLGYDGSHYSIAVVGTPEVLSVAPIGSATQDGTPAPDNYVPVVGTKMGNTELLAIGTDADTYDLTTQTITRVIGEKVLKGTESFGKSTAYGTSWYITSAAGSWGANKDKTVICTHFVAGTASSQADNHTCFFNSSGHFYFRASEFADATAFKAWVKEQYDNGTPVVVYFVRSSSTTEAYTGSPVGGTASVADLFAVGEYADTHELIGGTVTHRVGVKVLDGTEDYGASSNMVSRHQVYLRNTGVKNNGKAISTHYDATTGSNPANGKMSVYGSNIFFCDTTNITGSSTSEVQNAFKEFAAAQYAAGTPVIVLYPLAEETTESVTAQSLRTEKGGNTISVVSNVDPVNLTVEYKGEKE